MPSTPDDEKGVPVLPDRDFGEYSKLVRTIKADFYSLVDPSKHLSKSESTSQKTFETLTNRVMSFEKRLWECKSKLKSCTEELTAKIAATKYRPARILLERELQNKEMFITIVDKDLKELNSHKFTLMEELQLLYVITERDGPRRERVAT